MVMKPSGEIVVESAAMDTPVEARERGFGLEGDLGGVGAPGSGIDEDMVVSVAKDGRREVGPQPRYEMAGG
jgi:hypothetical protein